MAAASLELEDAEDSEVHAAPTLRRRLAWVPPLALLYALDKLLALLSTVIHFPASLIGMAAIVALLLAAERRRPALAVAVELWFRPGVVRAAPVCRTGCSWVLGCRLSTPGAHRPVPPPRRILCTAGCRSGTFRPLCASHLLCSPCQVRCLAAINAKQAAAVFFAVGRMC